MDLESILETILEMFCPITLPAKLESPSPDVPPPPPPPAPLITTPQLQAVMTHLKPVLAAQYTPFLESALVEAQINTPLRISAFLGELSEESGELRYWEEEASGQAYEGRKDLGNIYPGDGPKFKGRGPIQLTGRANYTKAGQALGLDLITHPEIVATPAVGFRTTCWYWTTHNLNSFADVGNFREITHRINGGYLNEDVREMYYARAKTVFGA